MDTWPSDLIQFLEENFDVFIGWCCISEQRSSVHSFETSLAEIGLILKKYSLIGYHCTKLTKGEISEILKSGMSLQNLETLSSRLEKLELEGIITKDMSEKLRANNQCNDNNRANMLWFCFYEPLLAGESGIMRFFQSWGGEALYNSHESNAVSGETLKNIGTPCVIKATVPLGSIPNFRLPWKEVIGRFLKNKGFKLDNSIDYAGYSTEPLSSECIVDVFEYPTEEFVKLTGCRDWHNKINSAK
ncbi:hypothetical protein [Pseudoalteromonas sp. NGC95]|uniref:hypothetical protein n=1 Tax=Pseudoalteromonas sp. NGC95 TaxID=2792051 RepID=UPI0018CD2D50|nr:hypothetical protein [Pseudoalteromonas sp. NGC95]MBH0018422.1 hypothetical protein [Pseudoalteromonas sp. NGC95]